MKIVDDKGNEILKEITREYCLDEAKACVCADRGNTYGKPENNFGMIAKLWSDYTGTDITPVDVCNMMIMLKIARIKTGKYKADNFIDIAGYSACACEIGGEE